MKNILSILALVVIGFTVFYYFYSPSSPVLEVPTEVSTTTTPVATTSTNVFTNSGEPTSKKVEVKMGQTGTAFNVSLKPLEILEESRCPSDVQCIQAGTVRVKVLFSSDLGTAPQEFALDRSVSTESELVKLVEVRPYPSSVARIAQGDYVFVFEVKKR